MKRMQKFREENLNSKIQYEKLLDQQYQKQLQKINEKFAKDRRCLKKLYEEVN